jgi:hypothetical protein
MVNESTDEFPPFPPLHEEVPVENVLISIVDRPIGNKNNNTMTTTANTNDQLALFWERYNKYNWSNFASLHDKLVAAITEFVAAAKDVINFPNSQDA